MSADSMYVLVEMVTIPVQGTGPFDDETTTAIHRVIRTYESRERADEDLELLRVVAPAATYRVLDVPHIER